jgi:hypothetical protein
VADIDNALKQKDLCVDENPSDRFSVPEPVSLTLNPAHGDLRLAYISAKWDALPETVKSAIVTMIEAISAS